MKEARRKGRTSLFYTVFASAILVLLVSIALLTITLATLLLLARLLILLAALLILLTTLLVLLAALILRHCRLPSGYYPKSTFSRLVRSGLVFETDQNLRFRYFRTRSICDRHKRSAPYFHYRTSCILF